ncbi:hypothetical protein K1W54_07160 [Micromonospora sp. CPCC 205371]|nr:hypothetical protein [Micromonospora sp. CPCC 205371]
MAAVAVGSAGPFFAAVTAAVLRAAGGGAGAAGAGLTPGPGAAGPAGAGHVVVPVVPLLAFRLAGLRLTPLLTLPEHLQEEVAPEPSRPLLDAAAATDRYMTGLYAGIAAPAAVAMVLLSRHPGWAALTLILLASGGWLLAARPMTSAWHRLAQGVPVVTGLIAAAIAGATNAVSGGACSAPDRSGSWSSPSRANPPSHW